MKVRDAVRESLLLLSRRDRMLLGLAALLQTASALLDLVGVLLIGLVGALSVTTIQSQPPPAAVTEASELLGLGGLSDQALVLVLAGMAAGVLLAKSVISSYLNRRVLIFLANRQALVSARLSRALLTRPLVFVQKRSSQQTAFALIAGAGAATVQILGQLMVIVTELALIVVLSVALLFISPWITLGAIAFFAVVAFVLQQAMGRWAARTGAMQAEADIASLNAVQEALAVYREVTVTDRRSFYVDRIQEWRWRAAKHAADAQFIGMVPKYVFEATLVLGALLLAGTLLTTQDAVGAVSSLALYLAAGSRVMPALMRLQGAMLGLRGSSGLAEPTFELAAELDRPNSQSSVTVASSSRVPKTQMDYSGFCPSIRVVDVSFTYSDTSHPALDHVTLSVEAGASIAFVGRSGAGKSTLADMILGVLQPDSGTVLLDGKRPAEAVALWPGAIAYVPQRVALINDSIRANVALGLPSEMIDDDLVGEALERAHFLPTAGSQIPNLDARVGEHGVHLSGGQRQRIGLARALYTRPRLLVLDEATSALDAETEDSVAQALKELEGNVTMVIVAHRLSTVRHCDQVVYLNDGRVLAQGDFEDVKRQVPAFYRQAALMGLE